jgi:hypothetical protein
MKNLFDPQALAEVKERFHRLRPDAPRQWGTMTAPQMVAHCAIAAEMAVGDLLLPRVFIGYLFGRTVKRLALGDDKPFRPNSPTARELVVRGEPDIDVERARLCALLDRFAAGGAAGCTTHPHAFFGKLTPDEWAVLMYKHLDHHLRQFGA